MGESDRFGRRELLRYSYADNELGIAIALYDIREPNIREAFEVVVNWMGELQHPPTHISLSKKITEYAGQSPSSRSKRFGLHHIRADGIRPAFDWWCTASFDTEDRCCVFSADSRLASLDHLRAVAMVLISFLSPTYGIGYTRKMAWQPGLFGDGIASGIMPFRSGPERDECLAVNRWRSVMLDEYPTGVLRGVYPWNLLTGERLTPQVGKETLRDFIEKDNRGVLSEIESAPDLYEWRLDQQECAEVSKQLAGFGVLA